MTKIKLCGLSRACDIEVVNELEVDYIGFVFAPKSKRYVTPEKARELKALINPRTQVVGVFVNASKEVVADLLRKEIIDVAQLHGNEDEDYIGELRALTDKPIIKAFRINSEEDIRSVERSSADYVLLDAGSGGTGRTFDWTLIKKMKRPYFLAGGLDINNVITAIKTLGPFAVDVSSGIETEGVKDREKMLAFVISVRKCKKVKKS